jgi:hypothetical protein
VGGLRVVHELPGRLRVRVPPSVDLSRLADAVRTEPGVIGATSSARTRGLLVFYDPERLDATALRDALSRHSGREAVEETDVAVARPATGPRRPGRAVAAALRETVGELDRRVQRTTRGLVGLGGLFPLALSTWAVSQLVRGRVDPLSWSSALWYAHGLFRDYSAGPSHE